MTTGQEREQALSEPLLTATPRTVEVTAPSDLQEGYRFSVLDGDFVSLVQVVRAHGIHRQIIDTDSFQSRLVACRPEIPSLQLSCRLLL